MLITIGIYTPVYSFSLFLPTIIRNMGFSSTQAQLMSVPPYAAGCVVTIAAGFFADRSKRRGQYMLGFSALAILGWVFLISTTIPAVQYVGTFMACAGIFSCVPLGVAWNGNNIGGSLKRGVGIAMHVGAGNLGGVLAAFIYLPKDSPKYVSNCLVKTLTNSWQVHPRSRHPYCRHQHVFLLVSIHAVVAKEGECSS